MNIYKKLKDDTVIFTVSNFSSKILTFLLLPLYTNCLTADEYGTVDLINNLVLILFPILTLSLTESILRFSFDKKVEKNEVLNIGIFSIVFSSMLLIVITPFVSLIGSGVNSYWGLFIIVFIGYTITTTLSFYLRGVNKVCFVAFHGVLQTFIAVISNLVFLLIMKLGADGYVFSLILSYYGSSVITFLLSKTYTDFNVFYVNTKLIKDMLRYSIPLIVSKIAWWLNNSLDKYFIIGFVGLGASGIYGVAHKIPSILSTMMEIFNQAWQLSAIDVYENGTEKDKTGVYGKVHQYYITFAALCAAGIILVSEFLGKILFSGDFFAAWRFVPILIVSCVFSSLSGYYHSIFRAAKMTNILGITVLAGATANFVLNALLIPILGTLGAAYATMAAFFVEWAIACYFSNKKISLHIKKLQVAFTFVFLLIEAVVMSIDINYKYMLSISCIFFILVLNKYIVKKLVNKLRKKGNRN